MLYILGRMPMLEAFAQRMANVAKQNSEVNLLKLDDDEPEVKQSAVDAVRAQMEMAKSSGGGKPSAFVIGSSHTPLTAIEAKLITETLENLIFFVTSTGMY